MTQRKFELGQTLMQVLEDFQRRLDADLKARNVRGIRHRHRAVFMHLDRFGESRSVDLALAAGIRPQSMMKIVHDLEQMGLVRRKPDPADSRAKLVGFTAQGQKLIEELAVSTEEVWRQYASLLGETQLETSIAGLNRLLSLSEEGESDA